jgi:putative ribosome biogenesis GTPase RsgA
MNQEEILNLANDYKAITVKHDRQEQAKDRVTFLADFGTNVSLIVLAGPTGAGKSTLLRKRPAVAS